jgi:hypothetical protein
MNTKISVMFLSVALSTALLASQNGLPSDILNQANSEKADPAAFAAPIAGSDRMLQWTATNETASLVDTRVALVADNFESAETPITNEPSSLDSSLSSRSTANETASLVDIRSALVTHNFERAETQITNEPSSLDSNASRQVPDQTHDAEQPEGLVR